MFTSNRFSFLFPQPLSIFNFHKLPIKCSSYIGNYMSFCNWLASFAFILTLDCGFRLCNWSMAKSSQIELGLYNHSLNVNQGEYDYV